MLSARIFGNSAGRYVAALLATGLALLLRLSLNSVLGDQLLYLTLLAAVAFSAWFCGTGPSLSSLVLAVAGARFLLVHPTHAFGLPDRAQSLDLLAFLFVSAIFIAFGDLNRRSREEIQSTREELEAQVKERTGQLDAANKHLRHLTGHILHLQDEERRRIARELHDSAGQSLAALAMNLSRVETELGAQTEALAKTAATACDSASLVKEVTKQIRTVSYLLHPPMLDEAGLGPALRWYIEGFAERSSIAVDLDLPDDFGRLPQEFETAIFRVVQECLTNILRHSESSVAKVRIVRSLDEVRLEVRDQGKGISSEKLKEMALARTPGVGVRGMSERIRQLGGTLEIDSDGIGKGTIVTARLPVRDGSVGPPSANGPGVSPDAMEVSRDAHD